MDFFFILTTKFKVSNNYPTKSLIFKIEKSLYFCIRDVCLVIIHHFRKYRFKKIKIKGVQNYPIFW